jgi:uncharacterized ion transporter superfamily protein YfcC
MMGGPGQSHDERRFKVPDTALILAAIVVAAAVLTWIVPPGAYERAEIKIPGAGAREGVRKRTC